MAKTKSKTKKKTGLGIQAFFPEEETTPPATKRTRTKKKTQAKKAKPKPKRAKAKRQTKKPTQRKAAAASNKEKAVKASRRPAWLQEDHLERLEIVKIWKRRQLRKQGKKETVNLGTLLDEAIETYLTKVEKKVRL